MTPTDSTVSASTHDLAPQATSLRLATGLSFPLVIVVVLRSPRAFPNSLSAPQSNAVLPVPSLALQQARTLLLRRLPLASENAAHRLWADAELVGEDGRGERVGVVCVQRAQAVHCRSRKFVRGRPAVGEFFLQRGAVLCPA